MVYIHPLKFVSGIYLSSLSSAFNEVSCSRSLASSRSAVVKSGFDEETIRKYKRTKADPIIAPDKGQILWEVSVEGPSIAPFVGRKYQHDEVFCYISTPWGEYEKIFANFTGRIVEVCAQQGAVVNKGDVIAYLERTEFTA
jgi:pyruvate carboxylase subunit B